MQIGNTVIGNQSIFANVNVILNKVLQKVYLKEFFTSRQYHYTNYYFYFSLFLFRSISTWLNNIKL